MPPILSIFSVASLFGGRQSNTLTDRLPREASAGGTPDAAIFPLRLSFHLSQECSRKMPFKHTYLSTTWTKYLTSPHAKRFPSCYFLPLLTFHKVQTSIQHARAGPKSFHTPPSAFAFCTRVVRSLCAGWVAKSARTTSYQSTFLDGYSVINTHFPKQLILLNTILKWHEGKRRSELVWFLRLFVTTGNPSKTTSFIFARFCNRLHHPA